MLLRLPDGTAIDEKGTVVYFSLERFTQDICEGGHCFLCGVSSKAAVFNDEHILPRWLLAEFALFDKRINLPNGTKYPYGAYTIPCCKNCNSRLGDEIETPVSEVMRQGFDAVSDYVQANGTWKLYTWLSLIFLKTHLRDRAFRFHLDQRLAADPISKDYAWADFHHTHAVARAFVAGCAVDPEAVGTFLIFRTATAKHYEHFDYHDLFLAQSAMIRLRDIGIVGIFDDSRAAISDRARHLSRIDGPLSPVQLREVLAHLAYANLRLAKRPSFLTDFSTQPPRIRAIRPEFELQEHEPEVLGRIIYSCTSHYLDRMLNSDIEMIREGVKAGNYTFLYDNEGKFIRNSLEPLNQDMQVAKDGSLAPTS
jgi:hypothetical protein